MTQKTIFFIFYPSFFTSQLIFFSLCKLLLFSPNLTFFFHFEVIRQGIKSKKHLEKMFQSILKPSIVPRLICTSCYRRSTTISTPRHHIINNAATTSTTRQITFLQQQTQQKRLFHSSRPSHSPIIPIPAIILGALKTGKLVSLVSLSSKTSLTLLPHTFRRGSKGDKIAKVLASIPLFGFTLLLAVGLDQVRKKNQHKEFSI